MHFILQEKYKNTVLNKCRTVFKKTFSKLVNYALFFCTGTKLKIPKKKKEAPKKSKIQLTSFFFF